MTAAGKPRARIATADEIAADRAAALGDPEPSSGRSEPHPTSTVMHDVRFYGTQPYGSDDYAIAVGCEPCGWRRTIENGHTAGELVRLAEMHCGQVTS